MWVFYFFCLCTPFPQTLTRATFVVKGEKMLSQYIVVCLLIFHPGPNTYSSLSIGYQRPQTMLTSTLDNRKSRGKQLSNLWRFPNELSLLGFAFRPSLVFCLFFLLPFFKVSVPVYLATPLQNTICPPDCILPRLPRQPRNCVDREAELWSLSFIPW